MRIHLQSTSDYLIFAVTEEYVDKKQIQSQNCLSFKMVFVDAKILSYCHEGNNQN